MPRMRRSRTPPTTPTRKTAAALPSTCATSPGANRRFWVGEPGVKLRANIKHSRLSFMSKLTDFWGVRVGLQSAGLLPVTRFTYVIEVGGGTF